MGIFDALNTSVAGLQAQSFALQNISGNIANAQTTGYKGIGTSFVDLVPDSTTPNRQVAGAVTAYARATISSQGTVSASTVATYMAINGDGFFSVQKASGVTDNVPVFTGVTNYTRRGDFQVNANGNLVNGAGYYLMGVKVDPKTGKPLGNVPEVLQFRAGTGDHCHPIRREPADHTNDAGKQYGAGRHAVGGGRLEPLRFQPESLACGHAANTLRRRNSDRLRRLEQGRDAGSDYSGNDAVGGISERLADHEFRGRRYHHG